MPQVGLSNFIHHFTVTARSMTAKIVTQHGCDICHLLEFSECR